MQPTFVRTRTVYDSYADYWELVRLSGFDTCYVDEIRYDADRLYIVTPINGEVRPHIANERVRVGPANKRARLVTWGLERPDSPTARVWTAEVDDLLGWFDEVWVSDKHLHSMDTRARFVPLGSHPGLGGAKVRPADFDVAFMGYMIPRRQTVADQLSALGYRLAPNGWGVDRRHTLQRTRLMLNVHQHNTPLPIAEPLRIALAAAFRMPLVSETLARPRPLQSGWDVLSVGYDRLAETAQLVLQREHLERELGDRLYRKLCCEQTFREGVERGVESVLEGQRS